MLDPPEPEVRSKEMPRGAGRHRRQLPDQHLVLTLLGPHEELGAEGAGANTLQRPRHVVQHRLYTAGGRGG